MTAKTQIIKVAFPPDLIELLEQEAELYPNFTKMMHAIIRRHFLHQQLKEEFARLKQVVIKINKS